jgi:hypothetical protein
LKILAEEAVSEVARRIEAAGDHPKSNKLNQQVRRAYEHSAANCDVHFKATTRPVYEPRKLKKVASNLDFQVTPRWLSARSPLKTWYRSPSAFLYQLYRPGEKVVVFEIFESQGCEVWTRPEACEHRSLNYLQEGRFGTWFMVNPVHGNYAYLDRLKTEYNPKGRSRRCEECVTSWRYWVLESDAAPKSMWLRTLVQLPLPICAIYDSGGDSVHALCVANAKSKQDWDNIIRRDLGPLLVPLGGDYSAMTAVRLSRLPNCRRGQTGRIQRLYYLNPVADGTPIIEQGVVK